jgi:cell division protein FtsZ
MFALEIKNEPQIATPVVAEIKPEPKQDEIQLIIKNEAKETVADMPTKIGERVLSADELEERKRFEDQKRALEERAERLRRMSFNVKADEAANDLEAVPAYVRRNVNIDTNTSASSDTYYSGYTVGMNQPQNGQASIQTINTFLDGKKPD